jgi:hypothetical protein
MTPFRLVPISDSVADRMRHAPGPQEVIADENPGFPCRVCLRDAEVGDRMLLFTFSPFSRPGPFRSEGPVYIHAKACSPWTAEGVPALLRKRLLSLRAYDETDRMTAADVVPGAEAEALIEKLFGDPRTKSLHVHLARPGCFACEVERT